MRFAIVGNPESPHLEPLLARVERKAAELGISLVFEPSLATDGRRESAPLEEIGEDVALVLTLGGDGTLLRAARVAAPLGIPVLGCNLGRLGFLTLVPTDELEAAMSSVASGEYDLEERLTLRIEVRVNGSDAPESKSFHAINDAVIHKSGFARLISYRVLADDDVVGQYSADGIILATATGSTAYSLSAGGPIVSPTMEGIVATPISPHTLAVRPVVFPGDTRISVELLSGDHDLQLTVDGQRGCPLSVGDRVQVVRSRHPVRLVRLPDYSFFTVLRRKLHWGDVRAHPYPGSGGGAHG
ncbi:NAD(+)/NADH kinase [Candidatus Palauibacter sp.]|uniref:NAD(+)/NADH kinase n=1 Tax=Candidatus Palauibacter sp. TaxID=3101350 RepID=UPI003B52986E